METLSEPGVHPAELRITQGATRLHVKAYVWNLTHGGKPRSPDEIRIQVTGVAGFDHGTSFQTVILGWSEDLKAFAAFDVDRHKAPLGSSPSLQVSRSTVEAGSKTGIAARKKGNNEIVVAFRPNALGLYIERRSQLHNPADAQRTVDDLRSSLGDLAGDRTSELNYYADQAHERPPTGMKAAEAISRQDVILERLEELQNQLKELRQAPPMMGHNGPPPEAVLDEVATDELAAAAGDIRSELQSDRSDVEVVARRATTLERAASIWRALKREAAKAAKMAGDKLRERAVEATIGGAGTLVFHDQLGASVAGVVDAIIRWFHIIFN